MKYVDGYVLAIPEANLDLYRSLAKKAGKIWKEHGALEYVEAVGDDLDVKFGVPFTKMIKLKDGEIPIFSFITYKSKADRNRVNAAVMQDLRLRKQMENAGMPFDMKRMFYGGFKSIVEF